MDDDLLDYLETELQDQQNDFRVSLYALLPISVLFISFLLFILFIGYVNGRQVFLDTLTSKSESQQNNNPAGHIAPFFTPSVQYWEPEIVAWAAEWKLDPNLVATVMQIESCGHPEVVSSAGASGLFQVMPFHFKSGERSFDPATNAYRGLSYLSRSLDAHSHNITLALAGYNAGITGSQRPESSWPAETHRYTYWGSGIYDDALKNKTSSARLDEWLQSGGAGLCLKASAHLGITP